jgi:hypothetical protein
MKDEPHVSVFCVAQTSKSAVSRVSKPAGRQAAGPTWKSAAQQVWKPAPPLQDGRKRREAERAVNGIFVGTNPSRKVSKMTQTVHAQVFMLRKSCGQKKPLQKANPRMNQAGVGLTSPTESRLFRLLAGLNPGFFGKYGLA